VNTNHKEIKIAIIGGTGFTAMDSIKCLGSQVISTEFGAPSGAIERYQLVDEDAASQFYFLARHGSPHSIAPHHINYRANIAALAELGVSTIIAVNAVGSIDPSLKPRDIVLPTQVIDYSHGRESSFFDGRQKPLAHIDFSHPFDEKVLATVQQCAVSESIALVTQGVYGVTQGPRLETAAEIRRMARDGASLVGMTLMPEAALARELDLAYASICLVVNPAAGVSHSVITMEEIHQAVADGMSQVQSLVKASIRSLTFSE